MTFWDFLSVKNDVNVPVTSKSNKQKKLRKKVTGKRAGSGFGSVSQRYGSKDPDLYQHVTDSEH